MEKWFLSFDSILVLASDLPAKSALLDQLSEFLKSGILVTSSHSVQRCAEFFEHRGEKSFRSFYSRLRPALDHVLEVTERDQSYALDLAESSNMSLGLALEAAVAIHSGASGFVSSNSKIDSLSELPRIAVAI